jgi:glycosyltransferase involved in cell wall biosynthesis
MAKLSIILPSFNHGVFLKDRLNSILRQTFHDWEIIIIDDKSSDKSVQILTEFYDANKQKVKHFIVNESNSGSGYFSWKKGIELAETEYIWIAETDDYSEETFLEEQILVLEQHRNCTLSFSASNYVDSKGFFLYSSGNRTNDLHVSENDYKVFEGKVLIDRMPFNTYITNGSSVVFRKPKDEIPHEIFSNRQSSDIFLWTYLVQNGSFIFLNRKLNYFRRHDASITHNLSKNEFETIYHENASYLNYFKQTNKSLAFIDHYIENYIWGNKKDFLNVSSIQKIEENRCLRFIYFYKLLKCALYKFMKL